MDDSIKILNMLFDRGYQITPKAFQIIKKASNPIKIVSKILNSIENSNNNSFIIDEDLINTAINSTFLKKGPSEEHTAIFTELQTPEIGAKVIKKDLQIILDPTGKSYSTGKTEEFLKYFQDRYNKIKKIFMSRIDMKNVIDICNITKGGSTSDKNKIIAMVMEKRETKNGNILLELEDLTGSIRGIISKNNHEVFNKANKIILDQVICFEGRASNSDMFFIENFYWPDTSTQHKKPEVDEEIYAVLISDIHIGSKEFLEDKFLKFIEWLRGHTGNDKQKEKAAKVKYLIIAGDLVDGIGVYPKQENDLKILDIYEQYHKAYELLKMVPEEIEIIISPGNHDATRQALPQPAIPKKYAEELYSLSNVTFIGNPSFIKIHDVSFLIYHGRSLDDVAASIPGESVTNPSSLMKNLLISRHLAPEFGNRTPISPEVNDWLVIEYEPDVFHSGHVHVNAIDSYRNILIVNSGTWQAQTSYQKSMGISPTPCRIPIYDLKTSKITILDFNQ
ncbi:MAG: DNA-directed DNA polymerase II small subunit [Candidatus Odinarchaeia archaeon]